MFSKGVRVQCHEIFGKDVKLIELYENISSGPYEKYI